MTLLAEITPPPVELSGYDKLGAVAIAVFVIGILVLFAKGMQKELRRTTDALIEIGKAGAAASVSVSSNLAELRREQEEVLRLHVAVLQCPRENCPVNSRVHPQTAGTPGPIKHADFAAHRAVKIAEEVGILPPAQPA